MDELTEITLGTDSMSIFTALAATTLKTPQEKTLSVLMHWLKEKLTRRHIRRLRWYDTSDCNPGIRRVQLTEESFWT